MTISTESGWNAFSRVNASQRWRRPSAAMGRAATDALVAEARVQHGMQVLDIACGSGEPAISIATLLNDTGHVTGSDISAAPLEVARQRAAERGLTNITLLPADVHRLPFSEASFDRVVCRLGVMFFADPSCAFEEILRVLRPGGRFSALAWGPMEQPYFETTIRTIVRLQPQLADLARNVPMFKFAKSGTLSEALREAGFGVVEERVQSITWNWPGTPAELWQYFQEVTIPFKPLFQAIPTEKREEVNAAVLAALQNRYDGRQVTMHADMILVSASSGIGG